MLVRTVSPPRRGLAQSEGLMSWGLTHFERNFRGRPEAPLEDLNLGSGASGVCSTSAKWSAVSRPSSPLLTGMSTASDGSDTPNNTVGAPKRSMSTRNDGAVRQQKKPMDRIRATARVVETFRGGKMTATAAILRASRASLRSWHSGSAFRQDRLSG